MSSETDGAKAELKVGENEVRLEGSEQFVSDELSNIFDSIDITANYSAGPPAESSGTPDGPSAGTPGEVDEEVETDESEADGLQKVATRLNVDVESLSEHFYVEGDEVHIQDPMSVDAKFAFLGYCTIREILMGVQYHENNETKQALIDREKVNIGQWGSNFLYNLRRSGLIKDKPHTEKSRNKPFKITPSGREELVDWLNE